MVYQMLFRKYQELFVKNYKYKVLQALKAVH
jgi:hypothetical protein